MTSGFGHERDDLTSDLFSRLDDFENHPEMFRAQDGAFHFKLCYPSEIHYFSVKIICARFYASQL